MPNQLDESTRVWGMACHLSALSGFVIPFGSILGPLIVWLIQKNKHQFIDEQGKESVNFQISIVIYSLLLGLTGLILAGLFLSVSSGDIFPLFSLMILVQIVFAVIMIFDLIVIIIAAIKAYNGQSYRYPFNLRFLK